MFTIMGLAALQRGRFGEQLKGRLAVTISRSFGDLSLREISFWNAS